MINIQAEGLSYVYLTKDDIDLATVKASGLKVVEYPMIYDNWGKIKADGFYDMRLVLFQYIFQLDANHLHFLHWDDGTNLDLLDGKINDSSYSDEDFHNSLITKFGRTKCFNCDWEGYTLAFSTALERI